MWPIDGPAAPRSTAASGAARSLLPVVLAAAVSVAAVHLVAQVAAPDGLVVAVTQVLLMPLLAAALFAGTDRPRGRLVQLVLVALLFSWLGDTVPRFVAGEGGFLILMACFLVAQVCYAVAFWPFRAASLFARPGAAVTVYILALGVLMALVWGAGVLVVPVAVYGAALVTMAALATGLGSVAGLGGVIFVISDALIALRVLAGTELPGHGFFVMLTYVLGQALLVVAVGRRASTLSGAAAESVR
ncbi:lysoplasmalogenase [Nocardia shimofusensis]|uniref:lysoplasmalogenase n=1 Tax=Nocardia shimofusensis TaxID=228596 RepID=UPI00082F1DFF|nr:lysoplasmalogenase [Nocardia shimofusensis]